MASFDNLNYVLINHQNSALRVSEVLSNNAANVNTAGFKEGKIAFNTYLHNATSQEQISFSNEALSYYNTNQGDFQKTDNEYDFAIQGNGYFMINTPAGQRYTRAGNFMIDSIGRLVTLQGHPVLSTEGEGVTIPQDGSAVDIDSRGNIVIDGVIASRLGIAKFPNEAVLRPTGNNFFEALGQPVFENDHKVFRGMLETSNVNTISNMTSLIEAERMVRASSDLINISDNMEREAFKLYGN